MDDIKLKYFIAAAECLSFTEAAGREFTTQPNVSKQISALEKELDTKLFTRRNRTIQLTPAGEYLYEETKYFPAKMDQIIKTTRALGRNEQGELTIGLLAGQMLNNDIMKRFQLFHETYPEINYSLERAGFTDLYHALENRQYDLIITLSFDMRSFENLEAEKIGEHAVAVFANSNVPVECAEDLRKAPFIAISPKESFGGFEKLLSYCRGHGFEPNIVRLADSLDSLLFYVEAGMGVSLLDRNTRLENSQNIHVIPLEDAETSDVVVVWNKKNHNPNIAKMVEMLKEKTMD